MNKMYCLIHRLSDLAFVLDGKVNRRLLSDCEISTLENLTAKYCFPTVLDALHQLLGVSTMCEVRSRIQELSLEAIPYIQVVRAVTSMTVYNLIFQEDPFANHLQTLWVRRILEQYSVQDRNKAERSLEWFKIQTLDDQAFKDNLKHKAEIAAELIWDIIQPLIVHGSSNPTDDHIDVCLTLCSNIAEVAYSLNADIKARYFQPKIFWPIRGDPFDDESHTGFQSSKRPIGAELWYQEGPCLRSTDGLREVQGDRWLEP